MDFNVNKEEKTVRVTRQFAAGLDRVWAAWTSPELLEKWWAPKPYKAITKSMDFREGGRWLYYMASPDGDQHWCKLDYEKIDPMHEYAGLDAFCDEEGNTNTDFPRSHWTNSFTENDGTTTVMVVIRYKEVADMEKIMSLGFKEGFSMAMDNLDEWLQTQSDSK